MSNQSTLKKCLKTDYVIGEIAALDDLISTCDNDIGHFQREDLTTRQNIAMSVALERLREELQERRSAKLLLL